MTRGAARVVLGHEIGEHGEQRGPPHGDRRTLLPPYSRCHQLSGTNSPHCCPSGYLRPAKRDWLPAAWRRPLRPGLPALTLMKRNFAPPVESPGRSAALKATARSGTGNAALLLALPMMLAIRLVGKYKLCLPA